MVGAVDPYDVKGLATYADSLMARLGSRGVPAWAPGQGGRLPVG